MRKIILFKLIILLSCITHAQKYGGSAWVHVKDGDGNTRVLNVVKQSSNYSETDAKASLLKELESECKYNEKFSSQVYYSIDKYEQGDKYAWKYGGSASVRVKDKEGNTRMLNATTSCKHQTKADAKLALFHIIFQDRKYTEEYDWGIKYDINNCD